MGSLALPAFTAERDGGPALPRATVRAGRNSGISNSVESCGESRTKGAAVSSAAASNGSELSVLLADAHIPARAGIKRAIEPHGLRVVAEASSTEEAVRMAAARQPDICVMSVALPGNGIEAARLIKQSRPATKIVMMTDSARDEDMFGALRAGADGYLLMSTAASRLPHAILGVAHGEAALPRSMTARLILEFRERGTRRRLILPLSHREVELTAREFEVLDRLRKHERTAEIAGRLGISEVTVRRHAASMLRKLGISNRRSAIEMLERDERAELEAVGPG
jgi:DNA-binding NarL/FixJ family response regulator